MRRRLFTIASTLSLLLSVGTAAVWAWSETSSATIGWRGKVREDLLSVSGGVVHYSVARGGGFIDPHGWIGGTSPDPIHYNEIARRDSWRFYASGFGFDRKHVGHQYAYDDVLIPCWFLIAILALLPAMRVRKWYRTRMAAHHQRAGRCTACGYDLRATNGRCPECGTPIPTPEATA